MNCVENKKPRHRPKRAISVDGEALTVARMKAELSLEDVAKRLNRNRSTVSRWEQGLQVPQAEDILKMLSLYQADSGIIKK
jgi:transcriptional regulator with XRE-family HTH domain